MNNITTVIFKLLKNLWGFDFPLLTNIFWLTNFPLASYDWHGNIYQFFNLTILLVSSSSSSSCITIFIGGKKSGLVHHYFPLLMFSQYWKRRKSLNCISTCSSSRSTLLCASEQRLPGNFPYQQIKCCWSAKLHSFCHQTLRNERRNDKNTTLKTGRLDTSTKFLPLVSHVKKKKV